MDDGDREGSGCPEAVDFTMTAASHGWVGLRVVAGGQAHGIACSYAYDPFEAITDLMLKLSHGFNGSVEIDEEGQSVILWFDREPGSPTGRMRIFRPGPGGGIEALCIEAVVDFAQVAGAWLARFRKFVKDYDPGQWDRLGEADLDGRGLDAIDLRFLEASIAARAAGRRTSLPSHGYPVERATPA